MLSMKAKYGLRALLYLARQPDQVPVLISELAEKEGIPKKFLELILLELKNHGVLQSKKGKGWRLFSQEKARGDQVGSSDSSPGWAACSRALCQPNGLYSL